MPKNLFMLGAFFTLGNYAIWEIFSCLTIMFRSYVAFSFLLMLCATCFYHIYQIFIICKIYITASIASTSQVKHFLPSKYFSAWRNLFFFYCKRFFKFSFAKLIKKDLKNLFLTLLKTKHFFHLKKWFFFQMHIIFFSFKEISFLEEYQNFLSFEEISFSR